jgi:hypothetical protein
MLEGGIKYRIGTWPSDNEDDLSNYQEFENVVDALQEEDEAGNLVDELIFLCTDNSTVESAIVKENSASKTLFELTLEVQVIKMWNNARVIISQRVQLKEGILTGQDMMLFIPFHVRAIQ